MKLTVAIVILALVAPTFSTILPKVCVLEDFKCSVIEATTWTLIDDLCQFFLNPCELNKYICKRQLENISFDPSGIQIVDQETCQAKCERDCPKNADLVCARYKDVTSQFSNECELEKYNCKTGEPFTIYYGDGSEECD